MLSTTPPPCWPPPPQAKSTEVWDSPALSRLAAGPVLGAAALLADGFSSSSVEERGKVRQPPAGFLSFPPFVRTRLPQPTAEALKVSHIPDIPRAKKKSRPASSAFPPSPAAFLSTCLAARRQVGPALHALSVPQLVAHVVAEVVVAGAAHFVALGAVVVLVTAHPDGVLQPGAGALGRHRLLLLAGVDQPLVDAASDQQLFIWTERKAPIKKDHLSISSKLTKEAELP